MSHSLYIINTARGLRVVEKINFVSGLEAEAIRDLVVPTVPVLSVQKDGKCRENP
jgi:hypothetical protein